MKRNLFTFIIGLLLLLVFVLLLFIFQVRQSEVAMVTTFGKPTRPITEAGPHLKAPWPIQRVYKFDKRIQNFEDRLTEGITRDSFNLLTSVYIGWKITDPVAFFPKFAGSVNPITEAETKLEERLGNIKSAVIGKHALSDFVSTTDKGTNLLAIESEILTAIKDQVNTNNWGIEVIFLGLKKLELPESVSKAVLDRMEKDRKVLAQNSQNEGESEAAKIRSDADRRASELVSDAESQATQIKALGEAQAAESLAVFQKNPELAKFILQLDALKDALKDRSTLIFDSRTPPFNVFNGVSTNLLTK